MAHKREVQARIRKFRRILRRRLLARALIDGLLLAGILLALVAVARLLLGRVPLPAPLAAALALGSVLALLARAAIRSPSLHAVARFLDSRAATKDRLATALALERLPDPRPMQRLALADCARFARTFHPRRYMPPPRARRLLALLAPATCILLVHWHWSFSRRAAVPPEPLRQAIVATGEALRDLARRLPAPGGETPATAPIAREIDRAAERILAAARGDPHPLHRALAELSHLEQNLRAIADHAASAPLSQSMLATIAAALEPQPETRSAAAALRAGDLAEASLQLRHAIERASESPPQMERLSAKIDAQLDRVTRSLTPQQRDHLLKRMGEDPSRTSTSLAPGGRRTTSPLEQIADQLATQTDLPGGGSRSETRSSGPLGNALSSIQMLRGDLQDAGAQPAGGIAPDREASLARSPGVDQGRQGGDALDPDPPSGQPGSEYDSGTTRSPFDPSGSHAPPAAADARPIPLQGQPGPGPGTATERRVPGDVAAAQTPYAGLVDGAPAAGEETILPEEIPLGARLLIRRYFQEIRPGR